MLQIISFKGSCTNGKYLNTFITSQSLKLIVLGVFDPKCTVSTTNLSAKKVN